MDMKSLPGMVPYDDCDDCTMHDDCFNHFVAFYSHQMLLFTNERSFVDIRSVLRYQSRSWKKGVGNKRLFFWGSRILRNPLIWMVHISLPLDGESA